MWKESWHILLCVAIYAIKGIYEYSEFITFSFSYSAKILYQHFKISKTPRKITHIRLIIKISNQEEEWNKYWRQIPVGVFVLVTSSKFLWVLFLDLFICQAFTNTLKRRVKIWLLYQCRENNPSLQLSFIQYIYINTPHHHHQYHHSPTPKTYPTSISWPHPNLIWASCSISSGHLAPTLHWSRHSQHQSRWGTSTSPGVHWSQPQSGLSSSCMMSTRGGSECSARWWTSP